MLKKFSTNAVPGTMNQKELRTFFGGKVIYLEDTISINDDSIKFSHVVSDYNNGYQYFDVDSIPEDWETQFSENLTDLKYNNQSISLLSQTPDNKLNNTRWKITINAKSILTDYFYFRLKEQRVFKMINANELLFNNINNAIYDYIKYNIFGRYRLDRLVFYVKYYDLKQDQSIYKNVLLQYDPKFDVDVYSEENITNVKVATFDQYNFDTLVLEYNQSKSSTQYTFNYYFDLNFSKI